MLSVRLPTHDDAIRLALRLRHADIAELAALGVESPKAALLDGLERSTEAHVVVDAADEPLLACGVVPSADPFVGVVWALGAPIPKHQRWPFLQLSRAKLMNYHHRFPVLMNCVDERHAVQIAWLRCLGFTLLRRHAIGPAGVPFIEYARTKSV